MKMLKLKLHAVLAKDYIQKLSVVYVGLKDKIKEIEFLNHKQMFWSGVDISEDGDGSVLGYVKSILDEDSYILTIAADGRIYAPTDSSELFAELSELEKIEFGDVFETQNVTNMSCMFNGCEALKVLDIKHFRTQNVTDMRLMFEGCNIMGFDKDVLTMLLSGQWGNIVG